MMEVKEIKYKKYAIFSSSNVKVFDTLDKLLSYHVGENITYKHWKDIPSLQEFIKNNVSEIYIKKNPINIEGNG